MNWKMLHPLADLYCCFTHLSPAQLVVPGIHLACIFTDLIQQESHDLAINYIYHFLTEHQFVFCSKLQIIQNSLEGLAVCKGVVKVVHVYFTS